MTNEANPLAEPEEAITIVPPVLCRARRGTLEAVTARHEGAHALIVFRSEEEAEKYRAATGKYPEEEGFKAVSIDHEHRANIIDKHGCSHVALPEPWTGEGSVDRFEAEAFVGMLEESVPA
jgi:hypothetical protein